MDLLQLYFDMAARAAASGADIEEIRQAIEPLLQFIKDNRLGDAGERDKRAGDSGGDLRGVHPAAGRDDGGGAGRTGRGDHGGAGAAREHAGLRRGAPRADDRHLHRHDSFGTATNVTGDGAVAVIVDAVDRRRR